MTDVCIAGGGAAGMMAGIVAARRGLSVVILEGNEKLGKKLYITGKGRCNITNDCDFDTLFNSVLKNNKFLYSAFRGFDAQDAIRFFKELGLAVKTERGGRVFPVSDKSSDVIRALEKELKRLSAEIRLNTKVRSLIIESDAGVNVCRGVCTDSGERVEARATVVATGGISYPSTGSTGDGYKLAESAGMRVTELSPGLVPLRVKEAFVKDMQGLSLKNAEVSFLESAGGKVLYKGFGEMIFTHFGISGPVILSASSVLGDIIGSKEILAQIDFKPALDHKQLDRRLLRELEGNHKKAFKNVMGNLLPMSAVPVFAALVTDDPDKRCCDVTAAERKSLGNLLKCLPLTVTGKRGFEEAIITRGGVNVNDVDPKTMESKRARGLYFAGEVLDTDALTGGFNLQ